ncbi:MAG: hypothetical protein ACE5DI_02845 [Candidatus Micrarchaeia archaeon]
MANAIKIESKNQAKEEMQKIGVSPQGVNEMINKTIFITIKLFRVRNAVANILKQEALSNGADAAVNSGTVNCKVEKTDVLLMGTVKQLSRVVEKMKKQPPECPQIAEEIESLL